MFPVLVLALGLSTVDDAPTAPAPPPPTTTTTTTAPAPAATKPAKWKLLVLDATAPDIEKSQADTLTSYIASRAARFPTLQVLSAADLRELVTLEANKQASGCDEDNKSCLAEIAGALGADFVLSTRAGKLDAVFVVTISVFDARIASAEGRRSVQAWSLAELPEKIAPELDAMLAKVTGEKPVDDVVVNAKPHPLFDATTRTYLQIGGAGGAGVGVVVAVVGAIPGVLYSSKKDELARQTRNFNGTADDLAKAAATHKDAVGLADLYNGVGRWAVVAGVVLVVAGGAAAAAGFLVPDAGGE